MQFDFSGLDAELESLGAPAQDALALARRFAADELAASASGQPLPLDQIDRALAALESDGAPLPTFSSEREPLPFAPSFDAPEARSSESFDAFEAAAPSQPPAARASEAPAMEEAFTTQREASAAPAAAEPFDPPPEVRAEARQESSATLTQSQEIVLPDPVRDELSPESGELRLDGDDPSSGSFELPESPTVPRITPAERQPEAPIVSRLEPFDDVQDALEGSQPIMLSAPPGRSASAFSDRDPDAEFDALLSEATDPRGIPTGARAGSSGEVDTDDLLRGMEGDELGDQEVSAEELAEADADEPHEADVLTRSLFEDDAGENTEITDRGALLRGVAVAKAADADATLADELDADDLEIVMEDDEGGATVSPPAAPQSSKAPPPPPPPGADKRPSLLGRLFNKREPGSE